MAMEKRHFIVLEYAIFYQHAIAWESTGKKYFCGITKTR